MMKQNKGTRSSAEIALEYVLDTFKIPRQAFSIGEPAEQCVCLEKKDGIFTVFMVERGIRFEESQHKNEREAHFKMFYHLSPSRADYEEMCTLYNRKIVLQNISKTLRDSKTVSSVWSTNSKLPIFEKTIRIGDKVRIHTKAKSGLHEQIQVFEGTVVKQKNSGTDQIITVRRKSYGVACEKSFVVNSPQIISIESIDKGTKFINDSRKVYVHLRSAKMRK